MIQEIVSFFGDQGHRHAELLFLATCVVTPMFIVDFFKEEECFLTKYFSTEEEAEEAAKLYAFEGIVEKAT
jgi:hypothetical protein